MALSNGMYQLLSLNSSAHSICPFYVYGISYPACPSCRVSCTKNVSLWPFSHSYLLLKSTTLSVYFAEASIPTPAAVVLQLCQKNLCIVFHP